MIIQEMPNNLVAAVAQLLGGLGILLAAGGWLLFKYREDRHNKRNSLGNPGGLAETYAELKGRLDERTTQHGKALEAIWVELASIDKRIAESQHKLANDFAGVQAASELRWVERMDRLEQRVDRLGEGIR